MKHLIWLLVLSGCVAPARETLQRETRQVIVVIDGPIHAHQLKSNYLCATEPIAGYGKPFYTTNDMLSFTNTQSRHGENVVGIIGEQINTHKYCIHHISLDWFQTSRMVIQDYEDALVKAEVRKSLELLFDIKTSKAKRKAS